jgi:hypothetical protein
LLLLSFVVVHPTPFVAAVAVVVAFPRFEKIDERALIGLLLVLLFGMLLLLLLLLLLVLLIRETNRREPGRSEKDDFFLIPLASLCSTVGVDEKLLLPDGGDDNVGGVC